MDTLYYPNTIRANPAVANTTSWVSLGQRAIITLAGPVDMRRNLHQTDYKLRGVYTLAASCLEVTAPPSE